MVNSPSSTVPRRQQRPMRHSPANPSRTIRKGKIPSLVGSNITPHVIKVDPGEDANMKITSVYQQGSLAISILSAEGALSTVTLRRPDSPGGTATFEGWFQIQSLRGSFVPSGSGVMRSKCGGLSISLISPDGCVFGGAIAGVMVAASPVTVVVGSYLVGDQLEQQQQEITLNEIVTRITPAAAVPASSADPVPHNEAITTITPIAAVPVSSAAPVPHNEVLTTITPIAAVPASSADSIPNLSSPASFRGDV